MADEFDPEAYLNDDGSHDAPRAQAPSQEAFDPEAYLNDDGSHDAPRAQAPSQEAFDPEAYLRSFNHDEAFDPEAYLRSFDNGPAAETPLKTFGREAAHGVAPAAGAVLAGAGAGALAGTLGAGPIGTIAGALVGGFAGAYATTTAQEAGLDALGLDDSAQRAINEQENPKSSFAGQMAPALATMRPDRAAGPAARLMAAGLMGGIEGGQELYNEGTISPGKVGAMMVGGALLPTPNRIGRRLEQGGQRLAAMVPGRPNVRVEPANIPAKDEAQSSQAPSVARGVAFEQPPPSVEGDTIGNPQSAPVRSSRDGYKKGRPPGAQAPDMLTQGEFTPDVAEALRVSLDNSAMVDHSPPVEIPTAADTAAKNMLNPGETLPIETGFPQPQAQSGSETEQGGAQAPPRAAAPEMAPETQPPATRPNEAGENAGNAGNAGTTEVHPHVAATGAVRPDVTAPKSAAQAEAGNYQKGHPGRMFGREVTIETPKGGVREDTKNTPPKWRVEDYPYDYGEFLGTKGADNDRVDVGVVGTGDRHFIVDQRDPETGKFDEHKVMTYAKDAPDALDHYERGFTDGSGSARAGAVTEISADDLTKWLAAPGKKKAPFAKNFSAAGPAEGEKSLPKVVTAAVKKMQANGVAQADIDRFMAMEPSARLGAASKAVNETANVPKRPDRIRPQPPVVEGLTADDGTPITARDKADAARKSADVKTMNEAYAGFKNENLLPKTPEEKASLREDLQKFLDATKNVAYKPNLKHEPYLLQRAAKKLLLAKNPTDKSWREFGEKVLNLREGNVEDVRAGDRIEADISRGRRSGDDAIANAEARNAARDAGTNATEDEMIARIDEARRSEGKFDVPHEEAEAMVRPEPVESASDVARLDKAQGTVDITTPEGRSKLQSETARLAENLVKEADRKPAPKESEGAASKVRQIKLNDPKMVEDIMARLKKAQAKNAPEGAVREDELGKANEAPKRDVLSDFWNNQSGELNYKKIAQDFRVKAIPIQRFLTKMTGALFNDRQRRGDAILAQVMSAGNAKEAEKNFQLFEARKYLWIDKTRKPERMAYIKAIENPDHDTIAQVKTALEAYGIDKSKIDWMADEAKFHRDIMDKIWQEDKKYGSDAGYRKNYVAHIFADEDGANQFIGDRIGTLGPTWYQKERMIDLIDQAIKAGFKLKFDNPIDIINARWSASGRARLVVSAARMLQNDGLAMPLKDVSDNPDYKALMKRWVKLPYALPDRQQWMMEPSVVPLWENSVAAKGLNENMGYAGSIYRAWMGLKNFAVPIQLFFSGFHELHIANNIVPAQALHQALEDVRAGTPFMKAYGRALKTIATDPLLALPLHQLPGIGPTLDRNGMFSNHVGRRMQEIWHTPDEELQPGELMAKRMFQEAGVSPFQSREEVMGAKTKFAEAVADLRNDPAFKTAGMTAIRGVQRGMEKAQEWMFKYQIPALKNAALLRALGTAVQKNTELANNETLRRQVFREMGKDIDDRFGEMFYKGLFWNKTVKDAAIGSFLSFSWNLGQVRQVAGAGRQAVRMITDKAGFNDRSEIENARATATNKLGFVAHYVGLSMLTAGAISYMMTGKPPTQLMDYIFPQNGEKNPDGTPARLTTPFNTREAVMLKAHADEHSSLIGGLGQLIWNKMVLQPIAELATNRDFLGNKLYDPNAPWWKEALQSIDATLGRTLNPISISGAQRVKDQGGGKALQAMSYAGFGPAPKYVNETPIKRRINALFREGQPPRPYEYGAKTGLGHGMVQDFIRNRAGDKLEGESRRDLRNEMAQAHLRGDVEGERQARAALITEGHLNKNTVAKMQPDNEFQYKFSRLQYGDQLAMASRMPRDEFVDLVIRNRMPGLTRLKQTLAQQGKLN